MRLLSQRVVAGMRMRWCGVRRVLWGIVACGVLLWLVSLGVHAWHLLVYPYPLDYGEGPLLEQTMWLATGTAPWHLYRNPAEPPYAVVNYPPLYPFLVALFSPHHRHMLFTGRLLSLLATFGCVVGIAHLASPIRASFRPTRWLIALLFLTIPIVREWAVFMRVDITGVLVGIVGLLALRRRMPLLAALCFIGALAIKPSLIAAPAAATLWLGHQVLAYNNRTARRTFLLLMGSMILGGGALVLALQYASNGWFWLHSVVANANRWDAKLAIDFWYEQVIVRLPLLVTVIVLLGLTMYDVRHTSSHTTPETSPLRLASWYTLMATVTAIGVGKVGAYANYFLEWYVGLIWITALLLPQYDRQWRQQRIMRWGSVASVLLLAASMAYYIPLWSATRVLRAGILEPNPPTLAYRMWHDLKRERVVLAALQRVQDALVVNVAAAHTSTLLTDYPGIAVSAGVLSRIQPFEHRQLYDQGEWNQYSVLLDMANGTPPLAIIEYVGNWLTPEMITMIRHRYAHDGSYGTFDIYRPIEPGTRFTHRVSFPDDGLQLHALFVTSDMLLFDGNTVANNQHVVDEQTVPLLTVSAGDTLIATTEWQRLTSSLPFRTIPHTSLTITLQLRTADGHILAQSEQTLLYGAVPLHAIPTDRTVQHMQAMMVPHTTQPQRTFLTMMLQSTNMTARVARDATVLAQVNITPRDVTRIVNDYVMPEPIYRAWHAAGGAAWAGVPFTPAVPFAWGTLQCFEHTCLELRDGNVTQRPLGEWLYTTETARSTTCLGEPPSETTTARMCPGFTALWQHYGEALLGAPISGEVERNGFVVQWTRYARLERSHDGSYMGLGRLGDDVQRLPPGTRYRWLGKTE